MIAATSLPHQFNHGPLEPSWQRAIADPAELCAVLGLDPALVEPAFAAAREFSLRVPRGYVARMRHGDPRDPLLLQVLRVRRPLSLLLSPAFLLFGAVGAAPGLGARHRTAAGRSRHSRSDPERRRPVELERPAPDAIDRRVAGSAARPPAAHPHALPGAAGARRCGLLKWLARVPLQKVVVIHANHANEIDEQVRRACADLTAAGATLLNQSVLLAGVNDSAASLAALSESLFAARVLPYYLHLLDKVQGAAHFDVDEGRALQLHHELTARLPGYLVPRLVREIAGEPAKTAIRSID